MAIFKSLTLDSIQTMDLKLSLEDYLPDDHLGRLVISIVDKLDLTAIESAYSSLGQNAYHPKVLLQVLFYGYTQGIRSGAKLEAACKTNIIFIYLANGHRPVKSTINGFKAKHHEHFKGLFQQLVAHLIKEKYTDGKEVFGDGSTIRANASVKRSKTKEGYEKWLSNLEEDINELSKKLPVEQSDECLDISPDDLNKKINAKKNVQAK